MHKQECLILPEGKRIFMGVDAARGCKMEFFCRDVYTLGGDPTRTARAVQIIREMIGQ